jgi:hypothetical protein
MKWRNIVPGLLSIAAAAIIYRWVIRRRPEERRLREATERAASDLVDLTSELSFPASDPPAWTGTAL